MKLQKLLSYVRKACDVYHMIEAGDRIAVGISGGKDSLALLTALKYLQRFYPKPFEIEAVTVSLGFADFDVSGIRQYCETLQVRYTVVETQIGPLIFDIRKEKNPCALCAKMRKGALNHEAKRLGCNKIALGHNKDDICQSFLMSLFYEGRIHTFAPVTYLDRMSLHAIRPLMFVPEKEAAGFAKAHNLPVVKSPCPVDGKTKREYIKNFIYEQEENFDHFGDKLFTAILNSDIGGYSQITLLDKGFSNASKLS